MSSHPQRPVLAGVVLTIALAAIAVVAAAWVAAPVPRDLQGRVARLDRRHGSAPVPLSAVAPVLREAVIATEDERFYRHHGIDILGVLRAAAYDITHFTAAQGASTIPEQLGKIIYLGGNDHSPWLKLQDAVIALRISASHPKQQVLADYLNSVYFGHHAYGIAAAARTYFAVAPRRLDLAQASVLAGLIQAPSAYDPYSYPAAARARQAEVLASMVRNGFITVHEGEEALTHRLSLATGSLPAAAPANLAPGPPFAFDRMVMGVALLVVGLILFVVARRSTRPLLVRAASAGCALAGALASLGSLRTI